MNNHAEPNAAQWLMLSLLAAFIYWIAFVRPDPYLSKDDTGRLWLVQPSRWSPDKVRPARMTRQGTLLVYDDRSKSWRPYTRNITLEQEGREESSDIELGPR